jgi:hypothetical protein
VPLQRGHSPRFTAAVPRRASLVAGAAQISALRAGLQSVTPAPVLALMTWRELREGVCGVDDIREEDLRAATAVSAGVPAQRAAWRGCTTCEIHRRKAGKRQVHTRTPEM